MMNICDYHLCTGCATCMNVCPHKAISMQSDKHGELHPVVDMANCIGCGLCINRCPVNQDTERLEPRKCLAVWEKSLNDRKYSASGGGLRLYIEPWYLRTKELDMGLNGEMS